MQTRIIPRIPEAECYICGCTPIAKLCHHCGRAMCSRHSSFTMPKNRPYFRRIENLEYTDLDLVETVGRENGVHCEDCLHSTVSYSPILYTFIAVGLAFIIGGLFVVSPTWLAKLYLILGMILVVLSIEAIHRDRQYRKHKMREQRPPLPVFGRLPTVTVDEFMGGMVALSSDGAYSAKKVQANGILGFFLQLTGEDRERLEKYRQKYALSGRRNIRFHAGFAVLKGANGIYSEDGKLEQINPIPLTGYVTEQQFLNSESEVSAYERQWEYRYRYNLGCVDIST